jgi:outer membrane protein
MTPNAFAIACLAATTLIAPCAARAAEAKAKYGVIDMQQIILKVEEGKKARADLEKEIKAKESDLGKKKAELEKMNEEFGKQQALMSPEARIKKQQEFQEKAMKLMSEEREFQAQIKTKEQKATQKIAVKIAAMAERIAKELDLEVVFESQNSGLVYLKDPVDLTVRVAEAYTKEAPAADKKKDDKKK